MLRLRAMNGRPPGVPTALPEGLGGLLLQAIHPGLLPPRQVRAPRTSAPRVPHAQAGELSWCISACLSGVDDPLAQAGRRRSELRPPGLVAGFRGWRYPGVSRGWQSAGRAEIPRLDAELRREGRPEAVGAGFPRLNVSCGPSWCRRRKPQKHQRPLSRWTETAKSVPVMEDARARYEGLENMHMFVIANALRRPIIMFGGLSRNTETGVLPVCPANG